MYIEIKAQKGVNGMKYSKKVMQAVLHDDLTGLPTKEQHKAEAEAILKKRRKGEKYA